jgi:hypothetical protein
MGIPEEMKEEGLSLSRGASIFGMSFDSLSREELVAVAVLGWKAYSDQLEEGGRQMEFLRSLKR